MLHATLRHDITSSGLPLFMRHLSVSAQIKYVLSRTLNMLLMKNNGDHVKVAHIIFLWLTHLILLLGVL
jgi:hypothetical protein